MQLREKNWYIGFAAAISQGSGYKSHWCNQLFVVQLHNWGLCENCYPYFSRLIWLEYLEILRNRCNIAMCSCENAVIYWLLGVIFLLAIIAVPPPRLDQAGQHCSHHAFWFFFSFPNNLTSSYSEGCKSESSWDMSQLNFMYAECQLGTIFQEKTNVHESWNYVAQ